MMSDIRWRPLISLENGLRQTVRWYVENSEWVSSVRDGRYRSYYAKYYENRDSSLEAIAEARKS
jgi:dTDP-glucose 4,6-dehydratase